MPKRLKISQADYEKLYDEAQKHAGDLAKKLKPMGKKEFLELQRRVIRRWREIMGEPMTIIIPAHTTRRYPIKQWDEDVKKLKEG